MEKKWFLFFPWTNVKISMQNFACFYINKSVCFSQEIFINLSTWWWQTFHIILACKVTFMNTFSFWQNDWLPLVIRYQPANFITARCTISGISALQWFKDFYYGQLCWTKIPWPQFDVFCTFQSFWMQLMDIYFALIFRWSRLSHFAVIDHIVCKWSYSGSPFSGRWQSAKATAVAWTSIMCSMAYFATRWPSARWQHIRADVKFLHFELK